MPLRHDGSQMMPLLGDSPRKWVVTGCGRSGTMFAARVMRDAGVECGHEAVFKLEPVGSTVDWTHRDADSSWIAVPYLRHHALYSKMALVVRHPLRVIRSWMELDLLTDNSRHQVNAVVDHVVYSFRPEIRTEVTQLNRCAAMWYHWNSAALPYANGVVRHEALIHNASLLLDVFDVDTQVDARAIGVVNGRPHEKSRQVGNLGWDDIRPKLSREIRRLAQSLGYYD